MQLFPTKAVVIINATIIPKIKSGGINHSDDERPKVSRITLEIGTEAKETKNAPITMLPIRFSTCLLQRDVPHDGQRNDAFLL